MKIKVVLAGLDKVIRHCFGSNSSQTKTEKQVTDSLPFFFVQFTLYLSQQNRHGCGFHQLHNPPPQSQPTTLEHSRSNLSPSESTVAKSSLSFPVVSEPVRARQDRRRCRKLVEAKTVL